MSTDAVFRRLHQIRSAPTLHRVYGHPGLSEDSDGEDVFEADPVTVYEADHFDPSSWGPWRTLGDLPSIDDNGLVFETVSRLGGLIIIDYTCSLFNEMNERKERKTVYVEMDALTGRIYTRHSEHKVDVCVERRGRTIRDSRHVVYDIDTERVPGWERRLIDAARARAQ